MLKIYHNPRCSKSRQTLALLKDNGHDPDIIEYLKTPLTSTQINVLLSKLGFDSAKQLMRKGEADFKAQGLATVTDEVSLITALVNYPKLIERPIVETNNSAKIGRPPEEVLSILSGT